MLKRQVCPGNTGGLTRSWSSSACPGACFRSTKEKRTLTASAEQGRNRENPPNTWFRQLLGASPQSPLSGPASLEQRLLTAIPARRHGGSARENPGSQMSREYSSPRLRARNCNRKWGRAARRSKANKEAGLVGRKVCFISEAGSLAGEVAEACAKADSPH